MATSLLNPFSSRYLVLWIMLTSCKYQCAHAQDDSVTTPDGDVEDEFLASLPEALPNVELKGAGASFPSTVYNRWMPAFKAYR